ncbi:MAG: cellulose binding domain-containing protein [Pseudomonadota bacterium]|nr:cellulose binding domain-containing protein [Pseudomonadota bacterium]
MSAISLASGRAIYEDQCVVCHSAGGQGGSGPSLNNTARCTICADFHTLWPFIAENMPFRNAGRCVGSCARDVAAYIVNAFSTEPGCSVKFEYNSLTSDRFEAVISIQNRGAKDVSDWRVDFSFPDDQRVLAATNAVVTQADAAVVALPLQDSGSIPASGDLIFGIAGTHGGISNAPTDLRLEAPPCFAAPPGS